MKTILTGGYVFTPSARTLDFSGVAGFDVRRLYAVLNQTRGTVVYDAGSASFGAGSIQGSVITLKRDTSAMDAADLLKVIYDDPSPVSVAIVSGGGGGGGAANPYPGSDYARDGVDATGVTAPAGGSGLRGWLSGIYAKLSTTLQVQLAAMLPSGTNTIGSVGLVGGNAVAVKTDSSATTQPVSGTVAVSSLPATAATDAALTSGNAVRSNIATATGSTSDAAYAGTGAGSVIAVLKGVYGRLAGTLTTTLATGSNVIGAVTQSGTWAVNSTLQAGSATVGAVTQAGTWAVTATMAAGSATIGAVTQAGAWTVQAVQSGTWNITNITGTVSLPTGAATSASQATAISALQTANQRSVFTVEFSNQAVAASANANGPNRDAGASPSPFSYVSFTGTATVAGGKFFLQASADNFASSFITVAVVSVGTASSGQDGPNTVPVTLQERVRYRYYRVIYANGATAGNITGALAFTAA